MDAVLCRLQTDSAEKQVKRSCLLRVRLGMVTDQSDRVLDPSEIQKNERKMDSARSAREDGCVSCVG